MSDTYTRVNWEDSPSTNTPISAENLNKMDKGIEDAHKKCTEISETIDGLKENGSVGVQSNYNQNDSSAPDFIKGRPCYDISETILDEDATTNGGDEVYAFMSTPTDADLTTVNTGDMFEIVFDGRSYVYSITNLEIPYLGNPYIYFEMEAISAGVSIEDVIAEFTSPNGPMPGGKIVDTGEDFCILLLITAGRIGIVTREISTHHYTINKITELKQLDEKFIPDTIAKKSYVDSLFEEYVTEVSALVDESLELVGGDS